MLTLEQWLDKAGSPGGSPASAAEIDQLEVSIRHSLPEQVRRVLGSANRPNELIGASYLSFLNVDDLAAYKAMADLAAPGFIPFASNGGGELYGFDARTEAPQYVLMPAIGMEWPVAMFLGSNWQGFWRALFEGDLFARSYCNP